MHYLDESIPIELIKEVEIADLGIGELARAGVSQ